MTIMLNICYKMKNKENCLSQPFGFLSPAIFDFKGQMLYQLNTVIFVTSKAQNRLKSDKLPASINILKSVCTEIWFAKD